MNQNLKETARIALLYLFVAFVWALSFFLPVISLKSLPPFTLNAARFGIAFLFALLAGFKVKIIKEIPLPILIQVFIAAVCGLGAALVFQVFKVYSYAPSYTDRVFILSFSPVFILFAGRYIKTEKAAPGYFSGFLVAAAGIATILSSWERPSTFSPFTRFPELETWLLLSAVCFALFMVMSRRLLDELEPRTLASLMIFVCFAVLTCLSLLFEPGKLSFINSFNGGALFILGSVSTFIFLNIWFDLNKSIGLYRLAGALYLLPVFLTLFTLFEVTGGIILPRPFTGNGVPLGTVLIILGLLVINYLPGPDKERKGSNKNARFYLPVLLCTGLALLIAALLLFTPAKESYVRGVTDEEGLFEKTWLIYFWGVTGGWQLLAAAFLSFHTAWLYFRNKLGETGLLVRLSAGLSVAAVSFFAGMNSTFNWDNSIPANVLNSIGSPYAMLKETPVVNDYPAIIVSLLIVATLIAVVNKLTVNR